MNPFGDRPKITTNIAFDTGEDMSLEVTVTIKSGSGHGAPWHVIKGSPAEVAEYLGVENFGGRGSEIQSQVHKVAAWASQDFADLNPGKG